MERAEVAIVGAGPVGLELAVALKHHGVPYLHLDAGQVGSTIAWWAPHTTFFSSPERIAICGVPLVTVDQSKATREEYLAYLRGIVEQFDLAVRCYERVTAVEPLPGGGFRLRAERRGEAREVEARRVVLAIGDMHRPRLLGVPGEGLPHVSHYLADPHTYFRQRLLIVGGKNSAVEAAIRCCRAGCRVTLSYRGEELDEARVKFWLLPEIRAMVRDRRIRFLPRTVPREIGTERVLLERLDGAAPGPPLEVEADFVLLLTGYEQDPTLFEAAGVELEGEGRAPRHDPETMETDVPGLYVIGTASAGTQVGGVKVFIETSHVHVERVVAHITGRNVPWAPAREYTLAES